MTDYSQQYFTIESLEDGNVITLTIGANVPSTIFQSFSYSIDNGANWTTTNNVSSTKQTISFSLDKGHTALCKGLGSRISGGYQSNNAYYSIFSSTKTFIVYGNISSLILGDNYSTNITSPNVNNLFRRLFYMCTTIISAENLILPYVLVNGTAQYAEMFVHCTSLTKAPKLTSESLTIQCYKDMFNGCTSLTTAPTLHATTLANNCYQGMFYNCSSLVEAPELPAATLMQECYRGMFNGCTSLNYIKCLATDISSSGCTTDWLKNVAATGTFYKAPPMTSWPSGASGIPSGWTISDYYDDYSQQYFTVQSQENSNTITFSIPAAITTSDMTSISYSVDGGENWITTSINGTAKTINITINSGDKILWKGIANHLSNANDTYCNFSATKQHIVYGNSMSLLYGDSFSTQITLTVLRTFLGLFRENTKLTDANNLILPATTITNSCYSNMFRGCTGLVNGPKILPATSWSSGSVYENMFYGCTALVNAPSLPGTNIGDYCYTRMFEGCTSIINVPDVLPAQQLGTSVYYRMFAGCTSLVKAPNINALTVKSGKTNSMYQMFYGCQSLNYITCLITDITSSNCTTKWLYGVAASGTFYKHPSMTSWTTGSSGIPSGWTTKDYMMLTVNGNIPAAVKFVQNGVTHDLSYLKFGNNLVWQKTT